MENVSFINKIRLLSDIILSSPLFLLSILVFEIGLILYIIIRKKEVKINKWFIIGSWAMIFVVLAIFYNKVFMNLMDNFVNYIFTALYFPNLAVYSVVLVISNSFFVISLFNKKMKKSYKRINIVNAALIDSLLVFLIQIVSEKKIDVYAKLTVFSNTKLLVLLELSTGIFTSWILLNLFINLKEKLKKYDEKEYPDMPDIIFN